MTRELRLFYLYRLLATSYLYGPIFMLFEQSRGLAFGERMALGAIYSGVIIAVQIPTGVVADRLGRRLSMIVGAMLMIASCGIAIGAHGMAGFIVAEVLAAVSMAACSGADSAYLYDLLAVRGRQADYAARESVASAWHLVGSAVAFAGGGALAEIDMRLPYVATAVTALVAVVVAWMMCETPLATNRPTLVDWTKDISAAIRDTAKASRLAWLVGYSAVVFTLVTATKYVYQPYLDDRGMSFTQIGAVYAGGHVIGAITALRTQPLRARFGDDTLLWALLFALAASFVGLAGAEPGPWMLGLMAIQAIATGLYSPLTKPLLNAQISAIDTGRRASLLAVESIARRLVMGVFAVSAGLYGQANVMFICGAAGLLGLVVLATTMRGRSHERSRASTLTASGSRTRLPRRDGPNRSAHLLRVAGVSEESSGHRADARPSAGRGARARRRS